MYANKHGGNQGQTWSIYEIRVEQLVSIDARVQKENKNQLWVLNSIILIATEEASCLSSHLCGFHVRRWTSPPHPCVVSRSLFASKVFFDNCLCTWSHGVGSKAVMHMVGKESQSRGSIEVLPAMLWTSMLESGEDNAVKKKKKKMWSVSV